MAIQKPTKPTDLMPRTFGGIKNNFSEDLQSSGYEPNIKQTYNGDNLNYQLDATGKELDYCEKVVDFINDMPVGKTLTVNGNNQLDYQDLGASLPIGSIIQAIRTDIPSGCLRLDGTEYSNGFDDFALSFLATGKIICKSFAEWQTEYTMTNGNVGFFGYDEETGKFKTPCIQAGTFLAQAVASGQFGSFLNSELKSHTHTQVAHTHTRGTMNITGEVGSGETYFGSGAFYQNGETSGSTAVGGGVDSKIGFDASRTWTGSTSSAQPAINATGGSDTYPKHIRYPFFVVVSNVATEEPSQVAWDNFVGNLDGKANKSLNNLDEQGEKHFLNKSQITNCVTEIPQRIKLELNNGVLTLKAGSKVIVPNGFEADGKTPKFEYKTLATDVSRTGEGNTSAPIPLFMQTTDMKLGYSMEHFSGDTDPKGLSEQIYKLWYDTKNNIVKVTSDGGNTWVTNSYSLPFALISIVNQISAINQVFNGMGYIGSTVWIDKGVKGLIPNGRNEDGTLNNIEFVTPSIFLRSFSSINSSTITLNITTGAINSEYDYNIVLNEAENTLYIKGIATKERTPIASVTATNDTITSFNPKQPFRAVDYNDKSEVSGWAMPSSKYVSLSVGANGASYTAPANGYFMCVGSTQNQNSISYLFLYKDYGGEALGLMTPYYMANTTSLRLRNRLEAKKGDTVLFSYQNVTSIGLYFVYAEGEV